MEFIYFLHKIQLYLYIQKSTNVDVSFRKWNLGFFSLKWKLVFLHLTKI